jgi:oxygen-independent coproporphyrinogen-3 oxidase
MAGIYIHIPFCRKACHYCDFHFSTNMKLKSEMVNAINKELELQYDYLNNAPISTIYFGGGTPSLLDSKELNSIIKTIKNMESGGVQSPLWVAGGLEITLEANPDDINPDKIQQWKQAGINRLSIGVQSFLDEDLIMMNRSHSSAQAISAIKNTQAGGITNISIDLIYGLPDLTISKWKENLKIGFGSGITHLSAYCLTVEKKTALAHFIKNKTIVMPPESVTIKQFEELMEEADKNNFIHYEISNFCKPVMKSKHNSSYWSKEHYLGIGPSAHSYNGVSRRMNVANNIKYIEAIQSGKPEYETEFLTETNKFNEYVMTHLRTIDGVKPDIVLYDYGNNVYNSFMTSAKPYIDSGHLQLNTDNLSLTQKGKLLADRITSDLFI